MEKFKAYLITTKDGAKGKEIRRFTVDYEVATNFFYLKEKLQTVFPILRGKQFTVTWKDIENDPITISSNEELSIALEESPDSTHHKLYIILKSDENTNVYVQPEEKVGVLHYNVICDGCDRNVQGFRYKCLECPDYDLCSRCEGNGLHSEHCMLRIAEPLQWSSRYGKRLAHHMKKFIRSSIHYNGREEYAQECPVMKERHRKHREANCGSTSILGTLVDFLNDTPRSATMHPMSSNISKPETATEATAACNEPQSKKTKPDANEPIDLLTIVEDTIAPVLNNLGININLKVKNDEKSDPKPNKTSTNQAYSKDTSVMNDKSDKSDKSNKSGQSDKPDQSDKSDKSDKSSDEDEWTIVSEEKTLDHDASDAAKILPRPSSSVQCTNENMLQKVVTPSAPEREPSNGNLYPLLPQPTTQSTATQSTAIQSTATQPIATQPTATQQTLYHPNPKIQSAVLSMMEMGFSNDGGWLTQLLVLKDGNVEKVLDMLSPVGM